MKRVTTPIVMAFVCFLLAAAAAQGAVKTQTAAPNRAGQKVALSPSPSTERTLVQTHDGPITYADVAPIFNQRCIMCHRGETPPHGLRLDSYAHIMKGSTKGPVVVSGKPAESELLRRIRGESLPRMPFSGPPWLSKEEEKNIEQWIAAGAPEGPPSAQGKNGTLELSPHAPPKPEEVTYADVAPIFNSRCVKCHASHGLMGHAPQGVQLDSYESIFAASDQPLIVPGSPDASRLVRAIRGQSSSRMPLDGPPYLSEKEIGLIAKWVAERAPDTDGKKQTVPVGESVRLEGRLTGTCALDGVALVVDEGTHLQTGADIGDYVEVRGTVLEDGRIHATGIRLR
jgi:uncharacterized membrane protein